jgi:mannose-6-phosphate isomerase-like protein (cupin superfamily)
MSPPPRRLADSVPLGARHDACTVAPPVLADDIIATSRANDDFRREVATAERSQVVVMTIPPGEEIGEEVHEGIDQILLFVEGECEALVGEERRWVRADELVLVPGGTRHNFVNTGAEPLRLVTVYAPPEHPPGTVHRTKAEADEAEH